MFKWASQLLLTVLIFTTPLMGMSHAIAAANTSAVEGASELQNLFNEIPYITYDQILNLLDAIENGALDQIDHPEAVDRILKLVAYITQKGALFLDSDDESLDNLESDTEELLSETDADFINSLNASILKGDGGYSYSTAVLYESWDIILCKNWVSKKIKQAKKYIKKHKKAFIIGGAVAVAAVAVVCIAAAAATAGTAALGEVGAAAASGIAAAATDKGNQKEDHAEKEEASPQKEISDATQPLLKTPVPDTTISVAVEEQIEVMQEANTEKNMFQAADSLPILGEAAREIGSKIVHDIVDGASDLSRLCTFLEPISSSY